MSSNPYGFFRPKSSAEAADARNANQKPDVNTKAQAPAGSDTDVSEVNYIPLADQQNAPTVYAVPAHFQNPSEIETEGILRGNKKGIVVERAEYSGAKQRCLQSPSYITMERQASAAVQSPEYVSTAQQTTTAKNTVQYEVPPNLADTTDARAIKKEPRPTMMVMADIEPRPARRMQHTAPAVKVHGRMSRNSAEAMLRKHGKAGAFLLRAGDVPGMTKLSVLLDDSITVHVIVKQRANGQYEVDNILLPTASSLDDVVAHLGIAKHVPWTGPPLLYML
eukprot:m.657649 g.657649  ORF g.657649 m.657649 type:complete len:279 (+) comp22716_c0_seq1:179-1015(+)